MVYVLRLALALAFALVLCLFTSPAFAFGTVTSATTSVAGYDVGLVSGGYATCQKTQADACATRIAFDNGWNPASRISYAVKSVGTNCIETSTYFPLPAGTAGQLQPDHTYSFNGCTISTTACPANSTQSAGTCTCNLGFMPGSGGTACVAYQCGAAGTYQPVAEKSIQVLGGAVNPTVCDAGCLATAHSVWKATDGTYWAEWPFTFHGANAQCGGVGDPAAPSPADTSGNSGPQAPIVCPNQCFGTYTVGGVTTTMCTACASNSPVETTTTTGTTNPDGSSSTKSTGTTCDPSTGNCTTTTTTDSFPPPGTTSTTSNTTKTTTTTTTPASTLCQTNPADPSCAPAAKSTFGGACAATTCTGDAVQCQIAQEQAKRDCAMFDTATDETNIYAAERGKTGPQYGDPVATTFSASSIDQSSGGVTASCIADTQYTIAKRVITIEWSRLCASLAYLGLLSIALSMLIGAIIIGKG